VPQGEQTRAAAEPRDRAYLFKSNCLFCESALGRNQPLQTVLQLFRNSQRRNNNEQIGRTCIKYECAVAVYFCREKRKERSSRPCVRLAQGS
jgi:hypothetical protein